MKKRFLVMLMVVAMSVSMFTACGDKEEEKDKYSYEEIQELNTREIHQLGITLDDLEEGVAEKLENTPSEVVTDKGKEKVRNTKLSEIEHNSKKGK